MQEEKTMKCSYTKFSIQEFAQSKFGIAEVYISSSDFADSKNVSCFNAVCDQIQTLSRDGLYEVIIVDEKTIVIKKTEKYYKIRDNFDK